MLVVVIVVVVFDVRESFCCYHWGVAVVILVVVIVLNRRRVMFGQVWAPSSLIPPFSPLLFFRPQARVLPKHEYCTLPANHVYLKSINKL